MVSWSVWMPATNFESCLGLILRVKIRRFAWVSISVTSISAISALVFDVYLLGLCWWNHEYWPWGISCPKNCENGDITDCTNLGLEVVLLSSFTVLLCISWSFWASRESKRCSSSFTNSMAPPTIEAWSPYTQKQLEKKIITKQIIKLIVLKSRDFVFTLQSPFPGPQFIIIKFCSTVLTTMPYGIYSLHYDNYITKGDRIILKFLK